MSRRENWVRMPKEPAAPWFKLGCYERFVGMQLVLQLDAHDGTGEGLLDASVTRILRGNIQDRNERQRVRKAVAKLQDLGLVFEHGGLVYVLYGHKAWMEHRELGERLAEERLAAGKPAVGDVDEGVSKKARAAGKASAAKRAQKPANDNAQPAAERCASVDPALLQRWSQNDLTSENRSTPVRRERERVKQSTTCSGDAQPSAAPPPPVICIEEERAKREKQAPKRARRKTPLDQARAALVAAFGELFEAKYPGRKSLPKRQDLLTIAAKSFQRPDGTLDDVRARAAMRAFLNDGWWTAQSSRPGHSFDAWAKHYERYETLAERDRVAEQNSRVIIHAF